MSKSKIVYQNVDARQIAFSIMDDMAEKEEINSLQVVGSLRRGEDIVNDIDILCIPNHLGSSTYAMSIWVSYLEKKGYEIESAGVNRIIARDMGGTGGYGEYPYRPDINIFFTEKDSFGAALMHTTGPSRYNIRKRYLVKNHIVDKPNWKLNEKGLYNDEGVKMGGWTEEDIYETLGWAYCPPYMRE